MVGAGTFMRAVKKGTMFVIYATPVAEPIHRTNGLPMQYEEYQDVFEKKNADMLSQHRLYDCAIEVQEGAQPPFGPIYGLF